MGYAIKKIVRIATIIVGLFIAGLAFLQYQQMVSINWDKFEVSVAALASAMTSTINENSIVLTNVKLWHSSIWFNGTRLYSWILERLVW